MLSWQKWNLESLWVWCKGPSKTPVFNFSFVHFDDFELLLSKILWKNQLLSYRLLKVLIISYFFTKIWDLELCKNCLKKIASLTARNLSKDNLLYHNLSQSRYLWKIWRIQFFFPFNTSQNQLLLKGRCFIGKNF